jgi:hypothetical protein
VIDERIAPPMGQLDESAGEEQQQPEQPDRGDEQRRTREVGEQRREPDHPRRAE